MHRTKFFLQYLKNPRLIGSITPSSKYLIKKMISPIDFSNARYILELGSGNGCITKELLKNMDLESKLIIFETNEEFCKTISKIEDERLYIINDSAEKILHHLKKLKIKKADYIISGLPLAVLPKETREIILNSISKSLKQNGLYIQFQYSLRSYKQIKQLFSQVNVNFTSLNIPPAFIYICKYTKKGNKRQITQFAKNSRNI
ncbi:hypothetical protein HY498_02750 [Candidatus Woesearchaeota archaeon]|nr:hypothetical protein [Candidatus Woesearchaeota archaeon]